MIMTSGRARLFSSLLRPVLVEQFSFRRRKDSTRRWRPIYENIELEIPKIGSTCTVFPDSISYMLPATIVFFGPLQLMLPQQGCSPVADRICKAIGRSTRTEHLYPALPQGRPQLGLLRFL